MKKKNKEKESKEKSDKIYYNITFNNCHDFIYEIEKILFNKNALQLQKIDDAQNRRVRL